MKKSILILVAIISSSLVLAQNHEERMNRIRAQKSAYITQRLNLTVEESQAFWPVYNEFESKMFTLKKDSAPGPDREKRPDFSSMTDEELTAFFEERFSKEEEELKLKRAYHVKFMQLLSPRQVAILYEAEHDFRRELLMRLKQGEQGRRP